MKTALLTAVFAVAAFAFSSCCGGAPQEFLLQSPTTTSTSGHVMFELKAEQLDAVGLSAEHLVISPQGSTANPTPPNPSPWKLEFVTDSNSNGNVDPGDIIRAVQLDGVEGGVDLSSGKAYRIAIATDEPNGSDGTVSVVTYQDSWTTP